MKLIQARTLFLGLLLLIAPRPAAAKILVGAEVHPMNFFILPSGTGLETTSNFGLGAVYAGLSASGYLDIQVYLSYDHTGSFQGSGTLFGESGTFDGKFHVFSSGVELKLAPPALPIFMKAGIGLCDLDSDVNFTVAGAPVPNPFANFEAAFEAHFGLGLAFNLSALRLHLGLDAVFIKIKSGSTSALANLSTLIYFRPAAGLSLLL
jgi:hypothetical protein